MENPTKNSLAMNTKLCKAIHNKSMLSSICAPMMSSKLTVTGKDSKVTCEPDKLSHPKNLHIKPVLDIWRRLTSNLSTVALCSSSRFPHEMVDSSEAYNPSAEFESLNESMGRLPGVQIKNEDRPRSNRRVAVNELQVNHLIQQETGMDRLRVMYELGPDWLFVQEDTRTVTTIFYRSVLFGFFLNAVKAAQQETKKSKHSSPTEAIMKMGMNNQLADSRRVFKEAAKSTVRLSGFAASLLYLSQSIAAYRNESSVWEYTISASVAMAIAGMGKPPKALAVGVLGGSVFGSLVGSLICSMMSSAGATQEQRTLNRICSKLEQQQQLSKDRDIAEVIS